MKNVNILENGNDIIVVCPECNYTEEPPKDEQRHHLQNFSVMKWLKDENDKEGCTERSVMECNNCGTKFLLNWKYKTK